MSWTLNFKFENGQPQGDAAAKLAAITTPEHREQANLAVATVFDIVASGALGDPDGAYFVNLSGHGNVKHLPTRGWANDSLVINISQV